MRAQEFFLKTAHAPSLRRVGAADGGVRAGNGCRGSRARRAGGEEIRRCSFLPLGNNPEGEGDQPFARIAASRLIDLPSSGTGSGWHDADRRAARAYCRNRPTGYRFASSSHPLGRTGAKVPRAALGLFPVPGMVQRYHGIFACTCRGAAAARRERALSGPARDRRLQWWSDFRKRPARKP